MGQKAQKIGDQPVATRKFGEFFSWNILNENTAIKTGDKSFFNHRESGIPKEIKWFFNAQSLEYGEVKEISLLYEGKSFVGRIVIEPLGRCRIHWHSDLAEIFNTYYHANSGLFPLIRFQKIDDHTYFVDFIDESIITQEKREPFESEVIPQGEGKKKQFYISKYERNPINRKNAIRIHGTRCMICGFDFEAVYGIAGRNFIEVHHVVPLSDIAEEVTINPETDLVCLCSNCHRIIHRRSNGVYSIDEVKKMIEDNSTGTKN